MASTVPMSVTAVWVLIHVTMCKDVNVCQAGPDLSVTTILTSVPESTTVRALTTCARTPLDLTVVIVLLDTTEMPITTVSVRIHIYTTSTELIIGTITAINVLIARKSHLT